MRFNFTSVQVCRLIGNTTIVDEFYSDLKAAIKILEDKEVIKGKYTLGFDNYITEDGTQIKNTYGLDLLSFIPRHCD